MITEKRFIKELIKLFANKTGCNIQFNKCPCNTCFHSIDADFKHICWLILLSLRGDYNYSFNNILNDIENELKIKCQ